MLTGVIFGLAPALHISKTRVSEVLKESGRSGSGGLRARKWTAALVVLELTLTLVLLAGAGFMMRSFMNLYRVDTGIETSHLLTMQFLLPTRKYNNPQMRNEFLRRMEEQLSNVNTVVGASVTNSLPLFGGPARQLAIDGKPTPDERAPMVARIVMPRSGLLVKLCSSQTCPSSSLSRGANSTARCNIIPFRWSTNRCWAIDMAWPSRSAISGGCTCAPAAFSMPRKQS